MGIFAVGFTAVAALLPVAIYQQQETINDVLTAQMEKNILAMLEARPPTEASQQALQEISSPRWTAQDRRYPRGEQADQWLFQWQPLAELGENGETILYACILRQQNGQPGTMVRLDVAYDSGSEQFNVANSDDKFRPGDLVIIEQDDASIAAVHRVAEASTGWFKVEGEVSYSGTVRTWRGDRTEQAGSNPLQKVVVVRGIWR